MLRLFGRQRDEEELRDELLSAYLDGELSKGERERLETRLSQDASLRAELRAMHRTVSLVQELPPVTAPRNFILTESMVKAQRPIPEPRRARPETHRRVGAWTAPLLTAATTAVSLLFVVVLVGDLLLPGIGGLASAPAPVGELPRQRQEDAPKVALEAAPTGEESVEEPEMAAEQEGADAEAPEGAGATPPAAEGGDPTQEPRALAAPTVAPTITSVTVLTPTIPAEGPVISEDELGLMEPTPSELEVTPQLLQQEEEEGRRLELPPTLWRALEIVLGFASLILTFATIRAWRLRRR